MILKNILKVFLAICSFEIFILLCGQLNFLQDDTYISLQYAKNFVKGNGFVFNIGEYVEGFTSFIGVIFLTIPYLFHFDPEIYAKVVSISFGVLCLLFTFFITDIIIRKYFPKINPYNFVCFMPVILLTVSGTFYYWAVSGMETTLYTFLCLAGIHYFLLRKERTVHLYLAISFLTLAFLARQESIIVIGLIFFNLLIDQFSKNNNRLSLSEIFTRELIITFLIFIIPASVFLLFRLFYFGYLFPNTFYAKTGTSLDYFQMGLQYTTSFVSKYLLYGILLILPLVLLIKKELRSIIYLLYAIITLYILYVIFVGGDVLAMHRFFIPILPLIYVLFTVVLFYLFSIWRLKSKFIKHSFIGALFFVAALNIHFNSHREAVKMSRTEKGLTHSMKGIALAIKNEKDTKERRLIAASTIGALKYFSDCDVLDMLGLTNEYIAHHPSPIKLISDNKVGWKEKNYNADYVLSRKQDYIIFSTNEKPSSWAERALFAKQSFHEQYFVYPLFIDPTEIPQNVYKRFSEKTIHLRNMISQKNKNYSPSFVNLYNAFLNYISRRVYLEQFDKTKNLFTDLIKISPSYFSEPYRFMGLIHYYKHENFRAKEYLNKCIEIDSSNIYSRILLYRISKVECSYEILNQQENYLQHNFPEIFSKTKFINNVGL